MLRSKAIVTTSNTRIQGKKLGQKGGQVRKAENWLLLDVKTGVLARTRTRTLQQFFTFCFHNLHRLPI